MGWVLHIFIFVEEKYSCKDILKSTITTIFPPEALLNGSLNRDLSIPLFLVLRKLGGTNSFARIASPQSCSAPVEMQPCELLSTNTHHTHCSLNNKMAEWLQKFNEKMAARKAAILRNQKY